MAAQVPVQVGPHTYQLGHPLYLNIRLHLWNLVRQNPKLKADLVIAHDYYTCDACYQVASHYNAKFSVDCHEYAREQYSFDTEWLRWEKPYIDVFEDYYLRKADVVTVVCEGIGNLLNEDHELKQPSVVIRNVPFAAPQPFRPVGDRIRVVYHGDLSKTRQIHVAIQSVPLWREDIDLVLRGSGPSDYIDDLKEQVNKLNIRSRVFFEEPVPFDQIVPKANEADIGFYSYEAYSPQIRFSLPNKFFEYIMAGLAICVSDLPEVARLAHYYGLGKLIPDHSPEAIAKAINSFSKDDIERHKKAAVAAALELNWQIESKRLMAAYNGLYQND
ncbi:glycosyltransferase [Pyruvatibacter mobilis]|uniref:glycosyltransferase n=1 Tax=Pyruvatibacter mobilis TaxID=1712261 RepID=UPI001451118B|nr:glycosyltransferase [Pyruvatibacter mobilis]QJD76683.1 glycosyltransferase family 4 protein [Pyruvatibacter mobilis]